MARKTIAELEAVIAELRQQLAQERTYSDALWWRHLRDLRDSSPASAIVLEVWSKLVTELRVISGGECELDAHCVASDISAESILTVVDAIVVRKVKSAVFRKQRSEV